MLVCVREMRKGPLSYNCGKTREDDGRGKFEVMFRVEFAVVLFVLEVENGEGNTGNT